MRIYDALKDFAVPILVVFFSAVVSWLVARYSAKQGAELGAQAASALERERNAAAVCAQQIESLQKSIFIISLQINDLSVWWKHIRDYVDNELAWLALPGFEDVMAKGLVIPVERLGFLVKFRGDSPSTGRSINSSKPI